MDHLLAVAAATLTANGDLIDANAGFRRLIDAAGFPSPSGSIASFFIQPSFAALLAAAADADGEVHRGMLTVGNPIGQTRSLTARVWRLEAGLRVLAEHDIEEIDPLCNTVLDINRDYADSQRGLALANLKLQQGENQLKQLVAELTRANTDLKPAKTQMLQSEKLASVGMLAAGVAHEINNPIAFVISNVGTLSQYGQCLLRVIDAYDAVAMAGDVSDSQLAVVASLKSEVGVDYIKEDIGALLEESCVGLDRVKRIVRELTEFSRVDAVESLRDDDINGALQSTLIVLENELRHCDVRKEFGVLPRVECVLAQIKRVFMNLLINAAQAIEGRGLVIIRTGCLDAGVWIELTDTGAGISPQNLPRIFDPFFTTKAVGKGTGLGLSVSYGIVERHHGRIDVESTIGTGSTFRVWLPIRQPAPVV
jgi:signal transduction histidine kinase